MTFTIWRGGSYQQVEASVKERWLGVTFGTIPSRDG